MASINRYILFSSSFLALRSAMTSLWTLSVLYVSRGLEDISSFALHIKSLAYFSICRRKKLLSLFTLLVRNPGSMVGPFRFVRAGAENDSQGRRSPTAVELSSTL